MSTKEYFESSKKRPSTSVVEHFILSQFARIKARKYSSHIDRYMYVYDIKTTRSPEIFILGVCVLWELLTRLQPFLTQWYYI